MPKRILELIAVSLVLTACAKIRNEPWPARIESISGFSGEEETNVRSALADLNESGGKTTLILDGAPARAFPITILKRDPPADAPNRAGLSTLDESHCTIEISSKVFSPGYSTYMKSVVWHEIGHCGGLVHTGQVGALMYPTTAPFVDYTNYELGDFFAALFSSALLK